MIRAQVLTPWTGNGTPANAYRPQLGDDYVIDWQDVTGVLTEVIVGGTTFYLVEVAAEESTIAAIASDPRYSIVKRDDGDIDIEELRAELAAWYAPVMVEKVTLEPDAVTDEIVEAQRRPLWRAGLSVQPGEIYAHGDPLNLWEVIQAHTTQLDWTPPIVPALFKQFYEPEWGVQPWRQPTGAHDAYPVGARVMFNGSMWENEIPANVWQPGVTGWRNLTPPPPPTEYPDWKQPAGGHDAYKKGDRVKFGGQNWESTIDANVWQPGVYGWIVI